ncbi:MAG: hypothetical protein QM773_18990 [Hyphomonadaceae bacterium]
MRNGLMGVAAAAFVVAVAGCSSMSDFIRGYASGRAEALKQYDGQQLTPEQRGAVVFRYSDFGALNTDTLESYATPWRLAAAAIALREVDLHGGELSLARVRGAMQRFGFLYPDTVGNWPKSLSETSVPLGAPLGMAVGMVQRDIPSIRLTTGNLTCAACHSGPVYDASGMPLKNVAWIGAPNTSINLEAYVMGLYDAFRFASQDEKRLLAAMKTLFPDTSAEELATIKSYVMPRVSARMKDIAAAGGKPLNFVNGAPGTTNGVAALRMQLGTLPPDSYRTATGFTSTPDLGQRGFRSALLYDGAYAPAGEPAKRVMRAADITEAHYKKLADIAAFFTVPSMGQHPDRAEAAIGDANAVFGFLKSYAAPRFPGAVDRAKAEQGRALFSDRCSACHGAYDDSIDHPALQSFPNWIGSFTTDPSRHQAIDAGSIKAVEKSAFGDKLVLRSTGQYAAPPLSGLWLSAPYLHNGTVPTLWQMMNPQERPERFMVGGHALDYTDVGIAGVRDATGDYVYRPDYQPWSEPVTIDTTKPGFGNQGHEAQFGGLSNDQKRAIIEYLKLL